MNIAATQTDYYGKKGVENTRELVYNEHLIP